MSMLADDFIDARPTTMMAQGRAGDATLKSRRRWLETAAVALCLGLSNGLALWLAMTTLGVNTLPHLLP